MSTMFNKKMILSCLSSVKSTIVSTHSFFNQPPFSLDKVREATAAPYLPSPLFDHAQLREVGTLKILYSPLPPRGEPKLQVLKIKSEPDYFYPIEAFRDRLGLIFTRESLMDQARLRCKTFRMFGDRFVFEVFTRSADIYARFIVLVHFGVGCTVWYASYTPGLETTMAQVFCDNIPDVPSFIYRPESLSIPGFEKVTYLTDDDINPKLADAFKNLHPFNKIPVPSSGASLIGISLAISVVIFLALGVHPETASDL